MSKFARRSSVWRAAIADRPGLEPLPRRADALAATSPASLRRRVRPACRPARPRPARTRRRVRLLVRSVPVVGLDRRRVRAELPLRSDPESINHPSALLLLRRGYSALTPRCRQRRSCCREERSTVVANRPHSPQTPVPLRSPRLRYRTLVPTRLRHAPRHADSRPPRDSKQRLDFLSLICCH